MRQRSWRFVASNSGVRVVTTEDSPYPEILYPHWQKEYQAAVLEIDPTQLPRCIEAAETAIYKRLQQLSQDSDHHTERQVIEDALQSLRFLKKNDLGLPDSEKE
jgi:hypothetical protein